MFLLFLRTNISFKFHLKACVALAASNACFALKPLLSSISTIAGVNSFMSVFTIDGSWGCSLVAMFSQFFGASLLSWHAIISMNVLIIVAKPSLYLHYARSTTFMSAVFVCVWILATMFTVLPFVQGNLGLTHDGTCGLHQTSFFVVATLILQCVVVFVSILSLCFVVVKLKDVANSEASLMLANMVGFTFAAVLLFMWLPIFLLGNVNSPTSFFVQAILFGSIGLVDSIAWIMPRQLVLSSHTEDFSSRSFSLGDDEYASF
jgi:hypothetical protein